MPIIPGQFNVSPGFQHNGGIVEPRDAFVDFIKQGFITPTGGSLTGTMSTAAWPNSANVAVAYAGGHRVFKFVGDSTLTYTYTANKDTYDDIDLNGVIYHRAVNNGAGAPAYTPFTELRLQKVVTDGSTITSVTTLAPSFPTVGVSPPFISGQQSIVPGGTLTLPHSLGAVPTEYRFKLVNITPELNYVAGDVLFDVCLFGKNAATVPISITSDATNLYVIFNTQSPVFQALNKTTGAAGNLTNASWKIILQARIT